MVSDRLKLKELTLVLLDENHPTHTLRPELLEVISLLTAHSNIEQLRSTNIDDGQTFTSNGLALSPTMAAMCADDYCRTIRFIRGLYHAIKDKLLLEPSSEVRVLYAGCGPFALLSVPLMTLFSPYQLQFSLLDIHADSIESVRQLVAKVGLQDYVKDYIEADASHYTPVKDMSIDIILVEVMQACLVKEPQVSVSHNLLNLFPQAELIPQKISLKVGHSQRWNSEDNLSMSSEKWQHLGVVFELTKNQILSWGEELSTQLKGSSIRIPEQLAQGSMVMVFTDIHVYKNQTLTFPDCGLNSPISLHNIFDYKLGEELVFTYQTGSNPKLMVGIYSED